VNVKTARLRFYNEPEYPNLIRDGFLRYGNDSASGGIRRWTA
jgi:hypothetical protein